VVKRFDRRGLSGTVERIHVIDGCQARGLPVSAKYERLYGGGRDVMHIRDGAQLPHLFALSVVSARPLIERRNLLHWTIFQVLIANMDAHAKNLSFFLSLQGMSLAPAYDLVSTYGMNKTAIEDWYAMAIGDAFMAVPTAFVGRELKELTSKVASAAHNVAAEVIAQGARAATVKHILEGTLACCAQMLEVAPRIARVKRD
jgi:serine/threonine-protein kinase HipA